jgi:hypothetical protein
VSVYEKVIVDCQSGAISVKALKFLMSCKDNITNFFEIFAQFQRKDACSVPAAGIYGMGPADVLRKIIDWRMLEIKWLTDMFKLVKFFVTLCSKRNIG